MADEEVTGQDAQTAGGDDSAGGQEPETFDRKYVEDLRKEAAKYRTQRNEARETVAGQEDYSTLKESADKWAALEEENKTELEKIQENVSRLQNERDSALSRVQETNIRSAFIEAAGKAGFANPSDVYNLADKSAVKVADDGTVGGVEDAVKALDGRLPTTKKVAPKTDGGEGRGNSGQGTNKTVAEIREEAARLNLNAKILGEQVYGVKMD